MISRISKSKSFPPGPRLSMESTTPTGTQPKIKTQKSISGRNWVLARKITQVVALLFFVGLFVTSRGGGWPGDLVNLPMRLDPLMALANALASRSLLAGSTLSLLVLLLTVVYGRAWCGWLCPLGAILDWFPFKNWHGKREALPEIWRQAKYRLLVIILMAALFGNLTLLFLDPLAIFFRTLTTAVWPALDQIVIGLETILYQIPSLGEPLATVDMWLRPALLPSEPVYYRDIILFAVFFIWLVLANILAERFWCRYLCPLGGLLGLVSRVALFRREVSEECKGCKLCTGACPTGTIDPAKNYASDPAECTLCMDCLEACPRTLVSFQPRLSLAEEQEYDPRRGDVLVAAGAVAVGVALFRSDMFAKRESPFLLRPPGARENNADAVSLTRCTRCNECLRACPTSALQPAVSEAGLEGFATPVLVPRLGYCDYSCNACGQVCPVQAIPPLSLDEKRLQVVGRAYIDQNRCIPWSDHQPCIVCEEMCPLPEKAIQLEESSVWGPDGTSIQIQLPHVLRDVCIGCGICEYKCPVSGDPAIRVYAPAVPVPF
jgi:polyferredoxin